jgi:hypothetical protein
MSEVIDTTSRRSAPSHWRLLPVVDLEALRIFRCAPMVVGGGLESASERNRSLVAERPPNELQSNRQPGSGVPSWDDERRKAKIYPDSLKSR